MVHGPLGMPRLACQQSRDPQLDNKPNQQDRSTYEQTAIIADRVIRPPGRESSRQRAIKYYTLRVSSLSTEPLAIQPKQTLYPGLLSLSEGPDDEMRMVPLKAKGLRQWDGQALERRAAALMDFPGNKRAISNTLKLRFKVDRRKPHGRRGYYTSTTSTFTSAKLKKEGKGNLKQERRRKRDSEITRRVCEREEEYKAKYRGYSKANSGITDLRYTIQRRAATKHFSVFDVLNPLIATQYANHTIGAKIASAPFKPLFQELQPGFLKPKTETRQNLRAFRTKSTLTKDSVQISVPNLSNPKGGSSTLERTGKLPISLKRPRINKRETKDLVKKENPRTSLSECFKKLAKELKGIQSSLRPGLKDDRSLANKLYSAYKNVPKTTIARMNLAFTFTAAVANIRRAIAFAIKTSRPFAKARAYASSSEPHDHTCSHNTLKADSDLDEEYESSIEGLPLVSTEEFDQFIAGLLDEPLESSSYANMSEGFMITYGTFNANEPSGDSKDARARSATEGETVYYYLTEKQLRTIHKRFSYPLAGRFAAVLKRAGHEFRRDLLYNIQNTLKQMLIKAYHSVGLVERYYALVRRAFKIVTKELLKALKEDRLQMAIKAINDTAGPNSLVLTLLVFNTLPKLTEQDRPAAFTQERAAAINKAIKEVRKCYAAKQVKDALKKRNSPITEHTLDLLIGLRVLLPEELQVLEVEVKEKVEEDQSESEKELEIRNSLKPQHSLNPPRSLNPRSSPRSALNPQLTDDVLMVVNRAIRVKEERELVKSKLRSKEMETFTHAEPMIFNRCKLSLDKDGFGLSVKQKGQAILSNEAHKCKRVTKAVLASKLYAMSLRIDMAIAISTTFA
ncbi:hypothetical protein MBM_07190 [Drepanopeziza brunnea f. sp. 'multigermtubi' MB_m1]|uniref:Polyprotein n=1 Tax=Marssonina brunnea f. sp. multigermtubi (strain MB_m1) TaxID=1072389 RepID=K1XPL8_MARBU|nr:uncharacterized protein MBM_07190 [Drepanopeziza brunnea f. sp. 'multigermtubi' MB_m1]EKD14469.1 hypothetical protein MBM_07190 [Drepanopeziza brunnea f. sp. 'multigermtubi' MB_m1]